MNCCFAQAEGFALISCPTLSRFNGHKVSAEVRNAVDAWAQNEACGRATAATVKAFREALLNSEGISQLRRSVGLMGGSHHT